MRPSRRAFDEMRTLSFTPNFTKYAEGSVLTCFGNTQVLCTASIEERVPPFLRGQGKGWVTAEYGMLPRSTHTRMPRESAKGKQSGRTQEIQRLIGRSLRASVNMEKLGERLITIDCDVIQADGGTRTASISGGFVALQLAIQNLLAQSIIQENPIISPVAAISVGIYKGNVISDLDYDEDSNAETDMNVVMNKDGKLIEVQATAEQKPFSEEELLKMIQYARNSIHTIFEAQKAILQQS